MISLRSELFIATRTCRHDVIARIKMADMREQEISAMTQAASKVDPLETEVHLEDDSTTKSPEFKGAMLELNGNAVSDDFEVKIVDGNLSRNRPHSQSMMSRKSTTSTVSKASLAPNKNTTDWFAKNFFCRRVRML